MPLDQAAAVNASSSIYCPPAAPPADSVWVSWNTGTTSTASLTVDSTTAICRSVWTAWNSNLAVATTGTTITASFTVASNQIWDGWNRAYIAQPYAPAIRVETPEQVVQRQAREAEYQAKQIRIEAERAKARERAEKLLRESLSPEQLEELSLKGHFHLETIAASGERRRYRINRGRSRNVQQVDRSSGLVLKTLCAHPIELVPDADTMLAQKLFLEASEEEFLRVANHS